jgi:class 3 adenylate cyclase/tetratricopeptide (TPR) repeat protein
MVQTCPNCGQQNPAGFRLCGYCGTALTVQLPPQEVRKTVTIVFSDLKGSTSLGESIDAEALRAVMGRYFDQMRSVIERHGGTVEKFIGDAIMAVFGLPRLHEDDALRAVRAAWEMQAGLRELNAEITRRWGVALASRIGVNTGEVVAGDPASGQRLVTGDAVNVAARLEQAAPEMEVLLGETTYRLVRDAVEVEELAPLALKGKADPLVAYRLLLVRRGDGFARRFDTPMVGRREELATLQQMFAEMRHRSQPALVTVIGPAGVGKTRLVNEFLRSVDREARILQGRCLSYGEGITFWPLGEVMRAAAGIRDDDDAERAYAKLSALAPDDAGVVERVGAAIGLTSGSFPLDDTFWATRRLLERLARVSPIVVYVEDIHWAEPTLLDLLEQLATLAEAAPLFIVCSSRHELLEQHPDWGMKQERFVRLELEPLSEDDSQLIVDHLLEGADLSPALRGRIVTGAAGHPLFVEQLVSMLLDEGRLRREGGKWVLQADGGPLAIPPTIAALLAARIDGLAPDERIVLERGSVIGEVFYLGAVRELSPETVRDLVGALLLGLSAKQLVAPGRETFASEETYRFRHILIREASYHGLLKQSRAELHERFADWLEGPGFRQAEVEEILGYHLEQAYRYRSELGLLEPAGYALGARAALHLAAAGRRSFARGDVPAATNLLNRAAQLLPSSDPGRIDLLCDLGEALLDHGDLAAGEAVATEAIDAARSMGDARLEANATLVRLLVRFLSDPDGWTEEALREADRAIPVLEEVGDHLGLARAYRLLGEVHGTACHFELAERSVQQSMDEARLANDHRQELRNLPAYATSALYGPMPVSEAIERCERVLEQAPGDLRAEGLVNCTLAQLHAMAGRFTEARGFYQRGQRIFRDLGGQLLMGSTSIDSASVELLAGDPEAALRQLEADDEALAAMGERYLRSSVAALMAQAELAAGHPQRADEYADRCRQLATPEDIEPQAAWRGVRARVLAAAGYIAEAESLARLAVDLTEQTDGLGMQAGALVDLAVVLAASGRIDEANQAASEAIRRYEQKGNVVASAAVLHEVQAAATRTSSA